MIHVSDAEGSRDRLSDLRHLGLDAELLPLSAMPFGDFAFAGNGPENTTVLVGIELKRTNDLLQSLKSKRFVGHQLRGMQEHYQRCWLVTEGIWRENDQGEFEQLKGSWSTMSFGKHRVMMADLERWIISVLEGSGLQYWHCPTKRDTARFIANQYHFWNDKTYEEHHACQAIYIRPPNKAMLTEPSTFVKMLSCIEGVGYEKALKVEEVLGRGALRCTVPDLVTIDGIGKVLAERIVQAWTWSAGA